jgi:hypothetical protein
MPRVGRRQIFLSGFARLPHLRFTAARLQAFINELSGEHDTGG